MEMMTIRNVVLLAVISITGVFAQEKPEWQAKLPRTLQADFPYTKAAVRQNFPKDTVANKGMAIIAGREAFMCFDTDLLRWSAAWPGNFVPEGGGGVAGHRGARPGQIAFGIKPEIATRGAPVSSASGSAITSASSVPSVPSRSSPGR